MSGILDLLTGGENNNAKSALKRAEAAFGNIQTPTAEQLTLPELQKYVEAGILTPAQAQTMLQSSNAYNDIKVDPGSMESEQKALGELSNVASDKGMTPAMQAQLTAALDQTETQERGQNASILDQMAQKGIPTSLMGSAAQLASNGESSRNANLAATQAAGQAEQNAINAMMNEGNLASSMHGQQYSEAANKAAAQNAMQQWNAGQTNATSEANANRGQQANVYNTENKQNVANQNTGLSNQRTQYNAQVPQQVFNNAITKASGQSGINQAQANQSTQAGNQITGLIGAGIGAGATLLGKDDPKTPMAANGMIVPGQAEVSGDSPQNDKVHAMLSPGEVVVPRSLTHDPNAVKNFVTHLIKQKPASVHPDDVHSVLEALTKRRESPQVGSTRG